MNRCFPMKRNFSSLRACLLAAACVCLSTLAGAQVPTLRETRVTATRFVEPAASLPLGVSVLTADEIRASGAASVPDALVRLLGVPGRQDLFNGGDTSVDLRGFGATADNNQVVVLDGIRLSEADLTSPRLAGIPIESIERIEVLRGSGAVLYGEGATGGVVVITTKAGAGRQQPDGATLVGAAGSHALRELRAGASVSTASGFSLDANAQKRETKGHRANSASDSEAVAVTGQWSNDWLRVGARLARDDLDARLPGELTAQQYAADPRQSFKPDDYGSIRNDRATVFAQAEAGAWSFAFEAGQRQKELRSFNTTAFGSYRADYDVDASQVALRARNETQLGAVKNILVAGTDIGRWRREFLGTFASVATQRSRAFYVKDDVVLAGGTRLSAGARTEKIEKDNSSSGTGFDDRQNAWELGISQAFGDAWTAHARYGRSFRLPNVDEFNFTSPGVTLRPQTSRDAELGLRWAYASGEVQARLYRSMVTDEIGFDPAAPGVFGPGVNVNFDPIRRQGLELDWNHALTKALGVRVNAAVRRATFRSGPYAGKDVPLVPRQVLAVRADWVPVAGHRFNAGVNWVASQHPDFANACRMPSHAIADARYAWQVRPDTELALAVTNLFDRRYYTQAFGCVGSTTTSIYPEPGRQFSASLRVQF